MSNSCYVYKFNLLMLYILFYKKFSLNMYMFINTIVYKLKLIQIMTGA